MSFFSLSKKMIKPDQPPWGKPGLGWVPLMPVADYIEDFESGLGAWVNIAGNASNWKINSGSTGSSGTGPSSAYSGSNYIYIETSSGDGSYYSGDTDIIEYELVDGDTGYVDFWFHQYGTNQGTLYLEAYDPKNEEWEVLWKSSINEPEWRNVGASETSFSGKTKLRFRNVAAGDWRGDVALDLIKVLG